MRKYFIAKFLLLLPVLLAADPVTPTGNVVRPAGSTGVVKPVSATGIVTRPVTSVGEVAKPVTFQNNVVKPLTDVGTVTRPVTTVAVSRPVTQESVGENVSATAPSSAKNAASEKSAASAPSSGGTGKAPGTGSFSSFEAKDLKAAAINPNVGGLSKTREDAPSNALLDQARNKVDLSGNPNAIAPSTNVSESKLSKSVLDSVTGDSGKKKK